MRLTYIIFFICIQLIYTCYVSIVTLFLNILLATLIFVYFFLTPKCNNEEKLENRTVLYDNIEYHHEEVKVSGIFI